MGHWLSGWDHRRAVTLSRPSGAVTNYQMKVLVGESDGSVGEDVNCQGHSQPDFYDIRFTNSVDTILDHWIESVSGTTPNQVATFWVEFDSIGTSDTTFYMYYGKPGSESASNGANTFIVFDDFERGNDGDAVGGNWLGVTRAAIDTGQFFSGTRSCEFPRPAAGDSTAYYPYTAASNEYSIRFRMRIGANGVNDQKYFGNHGDGSTRLVTAVLNTTEDIQYYTTGWNSTSNTMSIDTWHLIELNNFDFTANTADIIFNGSTIANNAGHQTSASDQNAITFLNTSNVTASSFWIDDFIVRNWRTIEPSFGAWGLQENFRLTSPLPAGRPGF